MYSPQYGNVQARMAELAKERLQTVCDLAREYHRRGDTVLRDQAEETIRELCSTRAQAAKILAGLYTSNQEARS